MKFSGKGQHFAGDIRVLAAELNYDKTELM